MDVEAIDKGSAGKAGRKPSSSGPRSIAALSAEQIARKRATDRACQRVFRQKRRERVEQLEARYKELLRNAPDKAELQAAKQRGIELEEELKRLRAVLDKRKAELGIELTEPSQSSLTVVPNPTPRPSFRDSQAVKSSVSTPKPYLPAVSKSEPDQSTSIGSALIQDSSSGSIWPTTVATDDRPHLSLRPSAQVQRRVSINDVDTVELRSTPLITSPDRKQRPATYFMRQPCLHEWEIPPALRSPSTPIDKILYGMVQHQRALSKKGIHSIELAGPRNPSMTALVAPEQSATVHTVARVISDLLNKITYRTFVDKLGAFLVIYPIYQWLIMQSYETYHNLPSWLLPLLSQRTTPHPIWIIAVGTPTLRDVIIANQEKYDTEEFQFLFVASINVNWPHGLEAALSRKHGGIAASKAFWDHARDLKNWTLDEPFQSRYPELKGFVPFTKYPGKDVRVGNLPA
ncbi:uncharacterized protein LY89DRAFT_673020 [Mollisia scopiformis]|uniref:BZIP transcription factor n=1 Tax=Mollisia scopiformis TaxID=149040 RepID=A0A194WYZ4_MOLSC|nr:uncharacterized protein LY89DRAFT_673020 [Mollisia scopiformis]KUJ12914.1 hypothetical protein LY89DRAFT_673020 [Mollisia scopiformis]